MALFLFTKAMLEDRPIDIFNFGNMERDFTYIDDIIEGLIRVIKRIPKADPKWGSENPDPATSVAPFKLYNIGNNNPVKLLNLIEVLEACLGKKAKKNFLPIQPGDVPATFADVENLIKDVDFKPTTPIEEGVKNFVGWYQGYYRA
jgi:UDP-glucuronate 4-epimerase